MSSQILGTVGEVFLRGAPIKFPAFTTMKTVGTIPKAAFFRLSAATAKD